MDCTQILVKYYSHCAWCSGDTYDTILWNDKNTPKPTEDELKTLWDSVQIDSMREERNRLLQLSDFRALPDYPNRDLWLVYRQQLRDLPNHWTGVYPTAPE